MEDVARTLIVDLAVDTLIDSRDAHPIQGFSGYILAEVLRQILLVTKKIGRDLSEI